MYREDTIAAISTAQATAGIGIIRISGADAFEIAGKIFVGRKSFTKIKSHTINYGKIIEPVRNEVIDEVLLSKMAKPNTFTKEDVVEINCHGGLIIMKRILEIIVREGARIAEPGEFTKRAFLGGRIDLSQAEAVIDLINSKTEDSGRAALKQLEGNLSIKIKEVRSLLIELIAHIEVTVDYPEHDIEEITGQKVYASGKTILEKLNNIIGGFEKGRIIRDGISAVIVGRPNVGKSSLLNALSRKEKAIVTNIPGTTRDIIEEYINVNGVLVRIIDTAGIRETTDIVEKIGVERAQQELKEADLIIIVIDVSEVTEKFNLKILDGLKDKKTIFVLNKVDLVDKDVVDKYIELIKKNGSKQHIVQTTLINGIGLTDLENKITELFNMGEIKIGNEMLVTNIRHKTLIDEAISSIKEACCAFETGMPLDCITIDLKNAAESLGQITGESVSEDVMHEIFSRFCIGK